MIHGSQARYVSLMHDNNQQRSSPSYLPAELDTDFLLGESMRGIRLHLEFSKAEERLRNWNIRSTVVVFGSSRVVSTQSTQRHHLVPDMTNNVHFDRWYDQARKFAQIVSEQGGAMKPVDGVKDNVIATGGGPGLMEAANRGAFEAGAPSIGFNIQLPGIQEPNPFTTPELTFQFRSFAIRKMHLALRAAALVVFPGGFGTLDELFEVLTLVQTRKMPPIPIVCFDSGYWRHAINFELLMSEGMIAPADLQMIRFAENAEEAWNHLAVSGHGDPGHSNVRT
jgi:uncharacterized protein (TIGR00730 family)